ncbi:MAG: sn-glycerol-1-phosphate dehydrogenase [Clostridia bacterium]|nr:sn-glycerol-1-phosphate dehydrogenase [Clostridia bacterium]
MFKPTDQICECGKRHVCTVDEYVISNGAVKTLPKYIKKYNAQKAFIIADVNTYPLAGDTVHSLLDENGIKYSEYVFPQKSLEPDENSVGSAVMHFDIECDIIVTIGSGVLNDISKILATVTGKPYIIIATAPSMDGYASNSSSMVRDGLKISLPSKCPNVIIGDVDILKTAPEHMAKSGLGDMLAKYISICEWRISNLINGEYYCEKVADLVRTALKKCVDNADGLLKKNDTAIAAVFEGLIISGNAMEFAGISRPASGGEHYMSHVWDMRGLSFGTSVDLHGIQCAIGTRYTLAAYEQIKALTPNIKKATEYAESFSTEDWNEQLRAFVGEGAESMIALEKKEQKYSAEKHRDRIKLISDNWDKILKIIDEELPSSSELDKILDTIKCPKTASEIGIDEKLVPMTFKTSKDIRDKYVVSRLAWDLGVIDELNF